MPDDNACRSCYALNMSQRMQFDILLAPNLIMSRIFAMAFLA